MTRFRMTPPSGVDHGVDPVHDQFALIRDLFRVCSPLRPS